MLAGSIAVSYQLLNSWQNIKEELSVSHSAAQLNSDELPNMHAILAMFVQCICVFDPDISFLN